MYSRGDREREPQRGVEGEAKRRDQLLSNTVSPNSELVVLRPRARSCPLRSNTWPKYQARATRPVLMNASSNAIRVCHVFLSCAKWRWNRGWMRLAPITPRVAS